MSGMPRASEASEPRERSAPATRRARERAGEFEGRSPSMRHDFEYAIKKDVRNNPIVREVDVARQKQLWRSAGIAVVLVGVILFSVWQHFVLVRHGYQIEQMQRERAAEPWLAQNPRVQLHFTPTSGSWLNLVEIFFGIITRQAIRRGTFGSVKDLIAAIRRFIDGWNDRCEPFAWTKPPEEILEHAKPKKRKETSFTRH